MRRLETVFASVVKHDRINVLLLLVAFTEKKVDKYAFSVKKNGLTSSYLYDVTIVLSTLYKNVSQE